MGINTSPTIGIVVVTPAKSTILSATTAGSASQLGSQSGAAANEVIVPAAITTNNEGNLMASPVYPGRLFLLRPLSLLAQGGGIATVAAVAAGGSSYAVNDKLTASGGTFANASVWNVDAVSGGAVTAVSLDEATSHGDYTVTPANPVSTTTGGAGTGATLTVTYIDGEELRFIESISTLTLTVHEDWVNVPVSGEDWSISYIVADLATVTGLALNVQSNIYEAARRISAGSTENANFAFWALLEGDALEIADLGTAVAGFRVTDGGLFVSGYLQAFVPVNGGYFFGINNTDGEDLFLFSDGGRALFYDTQIRSARGDLSWLSTIDTDHSVRTIQGSKVFQVTEDAELYDFTVFDVTFSSPAPGTNVVLVNSVSVIDGFTLVNTQGWDSQDDGVTETLTIGACTFIGNTRHVRVHDDKTWKFVDPNGWIPNSTFISFEVDDANQVERLTSLFVEVTDDAGVAILRAHTYIYEGLLNQDLPSANENLTPANGKVRSNLLIELYTFPSSVFTTATSGEFVLRIYKYTFRPFISPLPAGDTISLNNVLIDDLAITQTNQAQAVEDGAGIVVDRHATGETDPQPMKVLNYDAGTGSVPTLGEVMTQGTATGVVVEFLGDAVSGTLVLKTWNGTEFTDNQTITGGTSSFSAQTNLIGGTSFYEEYTWLVDANAETLNDLYDYLAAKMAGRAHPIARQDDGGIFTDFTEEAKDDFTVGDVDLMPATPAQNDAFYFADEDSLFEEIALNISTAATTSTIVWEYWNGSTWTALASVTDGTNSFTTTGENTVTYTLPTDWATTTVDGTLAYWIRARQSNASPVGQPLASEIRLDEIFEEVMVWGEGENSQLIFSTPNGFTTERTVALTEGVWISDRGSGVVDFLTSDGGTVFNPPLNVTLTIHVEDDTGANLQNVRCAIYTDPAGVELMNEDTLASGDASETFTYTVDQDVTVRVRESPNTASGRFVPVFRTGTITANGFTMDVILQEDLIAQVTS